MRQVKQTVGFYIRETPKIMALMASMAFATAAYADNSPVHPMQPLADQLNNTEVGKTLDEQNIGHFIVESGAKSQVVDVNDPNSHIGFKYAGEDVDFGAMSNDEYDDYLKQDMERKLSVLCELENTQLSDPLEEEAYKIVQNKITRDMSMTAKLELGDRDLSNRITQVGSKVSSCTLRL